MLKLILGIILVGIWLIGYYKYTQEATQGLQSKYGLTFHVLMAGLAGLGASEIIIKILEHV